jgi:hypothetical protein
VFTVSRSGFRIRCGLEADDATENRLAKILSIVDQCPYGVHDISRTETDGDPPLPRFNMPLELGIFLGAKRFGSRRQREKRCIIFDREPHRYQRFISDIAGQDIHSHGGDAIALIKELAAWLRQQSGVANVPGGIAIAEEYLAFQAELPAIANARGLQAEELTFADYADIVVRYLTIVEKTG